MRLSLIALFTATLPLSAAAPEVTTAAITPESAAGANGLTRTLVASEPLLKNPVALSVAVDGKIFVTETTRRKIADLDIRDHRDWVPAELALTSIDEKREFLRKQKEWPALTAVSEKIHLLEDTNNDGLSDKSTVFAAGFNTEVTGIAAGVLAWRGDVYTTIAPDVWKLRDTNNDGVADTRESIATGFGLHIAYAGHDMHGLTPGPDGRLYWSIGDKGTNVLSKEGKRWFFPHEGAVLRCFPDGSGFEVFAHGLRNLQQFAFDNFGNIFGVDNDADFGGEKERFVYVTEGSDSGWRMFHQHRGKDYNPWMDEHMAVPFRDGQLAYFTPPLENSVDGPAGFAFNPGTALNARYKDAFFVTQFPAGKITAFMVLPAGAGFRTADTHVVTSGPATVGCNFGPDGALYFTDWKGGYPLNDKGAVWKLDDLAQANSAMRKEVASLLRDGPAKADTATLAARLGHPDQRVRLDAQWELARRKETVTLAEIAANTSAAQLARIHAIWGISQTREKLSDLMAALAKDPDAEIRAQTARWAGEAGFADPTVLLPLINDASPRVCHLAAIAAGKLALRGSVPAAIKLLESAPAKDRILQHSAASALAGAATPAELAGLVGHPSAAVRLGAVVAMRRQQAPEVAAFLKDSDPRVVAEAVAAIYSDWIIKPALPAAAAALDQAGLLESAARRCMAANRRIGDTVAATRLANFAASNKNPEVLRLAAINHLASWPEKILLDPVDGRALAIEPGARDGAMVAGRVLLAALGATAPPKLVTAANTMASKLGIALDPATLAAEVNDASATPAARAAALAALANTGGDTFLSTATGALTSAVPPLRAAAAKSLAATQPAAVMAYLASTGLASADPAEAQSAVALLAILKHPDAAQQTATLLAAMLAGTASKTIELEILRAAEAAKGTAAIDRLLAELSAAQQKRGPLGEFTPVLFGGNATRGEAVFSTHPAAQCTLCHRVDEHGSEVGPPLTKIGASHDRAYLLESLLNPQAVVAPGYGFASLTLNDGSTVTGTPRSESATEVVLASADGTLTRTKLADIASRTAPVSTMPPMASILTKEELRDLIEFLSTRK
jgi:quinoprotein glucose dehydrogenase